MVKLNPENYKEESTRQIVERLIDHVTKTDQEIVQEGKQERKKTTDLKVYLAENRGLKKGDLNDRIEELMFSGELTKRAAEFFDGHLFEEEPLNEQVSYLEIRTPKYDRTDQFVLLFSDSYLRVLTTVRKDWAESTIEKLIRYIPELERVFLSSDDLESIASKFDKTKVSGFTAKYRPYYKDQSVTIQFHGAEQEDLEKVEEEFNARPSRLEISRANSPMEAVSASTDMHGYFSVDRIREGSEEVGYETVMELGLNYEERDRENFEVKYKPRKQALSQGYVTEGFTVLELIEQLRDQENGPSEEELRIRLREEIIEGKRRYVFSTWEKGNFLVFDKERQEPFEIAVENRNIILYAKPATTSVTLRDFCDIIEEEFNTTYDWVKTSGKVRV